jgi:hypothetical protein
MRRHRKTKWTQRGLQQTPKWNKDTTWIKDDNMKYKKGVEQRYQKPQKKE